MNQEELFLLAMIAEAEMQMFMTKIVLGIFIAFIFANLIYWKFFAKTRLNQRRWRAKQRRDIRVARKLRGNIL